MVTSLVGLEKRIRNVWLQIYTSLVGLEKRIRNVWLQIYAWQSWD
jgi:hypothetical protein